MYQWKRQIKVAAEVVCQVPDLQAIIAGDIKHLFFSQLENLRETFSSAMAKLGVTID